MPAIQIHLAPWQPLSARESTPDAPGVYVLAKGQPDNLIYIGKTWGGDGLRGRIRAFLRSATNGQKGHTGGVSYYNTFGPEVTDVLFAFHTTRVIKDDPVILNAYILYAERTLIWEHVELHGHLPVCNSE